MTRPTISAVIPAYNAAAWIDETLESVLTQTVAPDEVIVIDDGSTDQTRDIVLARGSSIRMIRQENAGAAGAWNRGFAAATCEFVAKCPADDLWEPQKLERQIATLDGDSSIDLLFGRARDFGVVEGDLLGPPGTGKLDSARLLRALYASNCFAAPTAIVRRSLHRELGGFREHLIVGEDYDFWLRALETGASFFYDDRLMTRLRKHGGNLSLQALTTWRMNRHIHADHASAIDDERLTRRVLANDLRMEGHARLGLALVPEARAAYRGSLRQRWSFSAAALTVALSIPGSSAVIHRLRPAGG